MLEYFQEHIGVLNPNTGNIARRIERYVSRSVLLRFFVGDGKSKGKGKGGKEVLRKIEVERRERERRRKIREEESMERRIREEKEKNLMDEKRNGEIKALRAQELREFHEKIIQDKEKRKKMFMEGISRYNSVKCRKPLFEKLEESYIVNEKVTTETTVKEFISKRSEFFKSLDVEYINTHEHRYLSQLKLKDEMRQQKNTRSRIERLIHQTNLSFYKPRIKLIINEEETEQINEKIRRHELKLNLLNKQKAYGNLAQELYLKGGSVKSSLFKKPAMRIKKSYTPSIKLKKLKTRKRLENTESESEVNNKTISPSRSVDYLLNKRKIGQIKSKNIGTPLASIGTDFENGSLDKIKIATNITKILNQQTKKLEYLWNSNDVSSLESEVISSAYIKTIRAKLGLLDKLNS